MTSTTTTSNSTPAKPYTQTLPSRKPTPQKLLFPRTASLSMRSRLKPDATNDESTPIIPVPAPAPKAKAAISRRASASLLMQKTKHMLRAGLQKTATLPGSFQRWQDIKDKERNKDKDKGKGKGKKEREREREKVQWTDLTPGGEILGPVVDIGHGCDIGGGGDETEDGRIGRANGVQALFEMPGPVRTGGEEESGKFKEGETVSIKGEEVESECPIGDGKALERAKIR
ncbi:hypothetical protein Hypma_009284 [Hypsizygus marmoreus]|uniref:Uncharacterized protein n=1 Tax=Hypsizygus marmoreus TaxID=39966 RepID=A0A369JRX9_HYPMA|nr:hypothetical protein Hypma_009284 [Hypsizygus marmoreus]